MVLLVATEHLHPGFPSLLRQRVPLRRVTRSHAYEQRRPYEDATDTAAFAAAGGTATDLQREIESGAVQLEAKFLPSDRLADALLSGSVKLNTLHDATGLSVEQQKAQAAFRTFSRDSAEVLFGDPDLGDFYAVMAHHGCALRHSADPLSHLFCSDLDPNLDVNALVMDLDVENIDEVCFQVVNADDIEFEPERIVALREWTEPEPRRLMIAAITKEISDLCGRGTLGLAVIPPDRSPMGSKLVLKVKLKADGSVDKYKARLCAQGRRNIWLPIRDKQSDAASLAAATEIEPRLDMAPSSLHRHTC